MVKSSMDPTNRDWKAMRQPQTTDLTLVFFDLSNDCKTIRHKDMMLLENIYIVSCMCLVRFLKWIFSLYLQLWTNSTYYTLFIGMVARQFHDLPAAYKLISGVCLHGAVTNEHLELSVVPLWGWAVTWTKATMWAVIWTSLPLAG